MGLLSIKLISFGMKIGRAASTRPAITFVVQVELLSIPTSVSNPVSAVRFASDVLGSVPEKMFCSIFPFQASALFDFTEKQKRRRFDGSQNQQVGALNFDIIFLQFQRPFLKKWLFKKVADSFLFEIT